MSPSLFLFILNLLFYSNQYESANSLFVITRSVKAFVSVSNLVFLDSRNILVHGMGMPYATLSGTKG